jgi:hypothetical protein
MHRVTAKLLLLFALLGNFVPIALAVSPTATPKCCLRKGVHHCHSTAQAGEELSLSSNLCGSHDCCRAATPAHWAHPEARNCSAAAQSVETFLSLVRPSRLNAEAPASLSTRAPPAFSIL